MTRAADGMLVQHLASTPNDIGTWNRAWGPEPTRVRGAVKDTRPKRIDWVYRWRFVGCDPACVNAGPLRVWCRIDKGRSRAEEFICVACGCTMWQADAAP